MNAQPAASVIVPVFKTEQYLRECLESVSAQTFTEWECIVVNDGSENTDLISSLAHNVLGNKGRVLHQNNEGPSVARNAGIAVSSGRYILCLDSDDYLHRECLAKTITALESAPKASIAFCWAQQIDGASKLMKCEDVKQFWLLQRNLITVTSLFKRAIWEAVGGFDETMKTGHEDWEYWIRASLAGFRFVCVPEALVNYRIRLGSRNSEATRKRVNTISYIRNKHAQVYYRSLRELVAYESFRDIPRASLIRFWLSGVYFHYVPWPIRAGTFGLYRRFTGS